MKECKCKNKNCETCKLNNWIIEAKLMKQDIMNGYLNGTVTKAQLDAYLSASFTVLEMLDKQAA